jgi:hypothetical protein
LGIDAFIRKGEGFSSNLGTPQQECTHGREYYRKASEDDGKEPELSDRIDSGVLRIGALEEYGHLLAN